MDLLGDIVEHDTSTEPQAPVAAISGSATGFPVAAKRKPVRRRKTAERSSDGVSEKEQIHLENIERLSKMSGEERAQAKEELINTLDPKILQMLLKRAEQDKNEPRGAVADSDSDSAASPALKPALRRDSVSSADKKVRFNNEASVKYVKPSSPLAMPKTSKEDEEWEDIEYLDESGPSFEEAQRLKQASVHFPRPSSEKLEKLDINDPDFNDKLHEKFFPDLPKDPKTLEWMKPAPETPKQVTYTAVAELRFDLNGDLITSENIEKHAQAPELRHHAASPELPGYTLAELAHYLRSDRPSTRWWTRTTRRRTWGSLSGGAGGSCSTSRSSISSASMRRTASAT
ncbi:hypothetical protein KL937_002030 [Ogataea polymorpha]|nr:hypothetical protein KL937_002030 [Ogataea polymorpha]KAG7935900.1 hypothetical protein KL904_002548 [Ogataea polymorpha]